MHPTPSFYILKLIDTILINNCILNSCLLATQAPYVDSCSIILTLGYDINMDGAYRKVKNEDNSSISL